MLSTFLALLTVHEELERYSKADILGYLLQVDSSLSAKVLSGMLGEFEMGKANV
jgi:hypothetical protein